MSNDNSSFDSTTKKIAYVFVHGIFSDRTVWDPIINILNSDSSISNLFECVTFSYSTPKFRLDKRKKIPDYEDLSSKLSTFIFEGSKFKNFDSIILIGHSQGGLIIEKFLIEELAKLNGIRLKIIKGVMTFATPYTGSEFLLSLRKKLGWIWHHTQERSLRPYFDNDINNIRKVLLQRILYTQEITNSSCPIPFRVYSGETDGIVSSESAKWYFPNTGTLPGNHSTIIKPINNADQIILCIKDFLKEIIDSYFPDNLVFGTRSIDKNSEEEINKVLELLHKNFSPSDCVRKEDLKYWLNNYSNNFGIQMKILVSTVDNKINGVILYHEHPHFIVIDYIVLEHMKEEERFFLKPKLLYRLTNRAKELDVPIIFEVEDPRFLDGNEKENALAKIRLFERDGARVINGLQYFALNMEQYFNLGTEEKYLVMYSRPGKIPDELLKVEVENVVIFLYKNWYSNWFTKNTPNSTLEKYIQQITSKVCSSVPSICKLTIFNIDN